jgi:hypothetical protein
MADKELQARGGLPVAASAPFSDQQTVRHGLGDMVVPKKFCSVAGRRADDANGRYRRLQPVLMARFQEDLPVGGPSDQGRRSWPPKVGSEKARN